jgi:hypothetical protein
VYSMVQRREKEKDSRYMDEISAPAAVTVYQICNLSRHQYTCNKNCYDMEVGENRVRGFYGTEKREGTDLRYIQEASAPAAVTVYQTCNIMYICNKNCYKCKADEVYSTISGEALSVYT